MHADRDALRIKAPLVYHFLSHQIIDISSLLDNVARSKVFDNGSNQPNRAMSENEATISRLKWYQAWLRENMHRKWTKGTVRPATVWRAGLEVMNASC